MMDFVNVISMVSPLCHISKNYDTFANIVAAFDTFETNFETASSSAECSRDKPPFSFVRGQDSTM